MLRAFPALSFPKAPKSTKAPKGAKNVLFLVADDMRPSISPYGFNYSHTPNMQRIADEGIAFSRAYIQQSYCAPSRNSFMSGRRPDANKVFSFIGHYREENTGSTNWTALPGYFLKHGYNVAGHGKLFHPNVPPNYDQPFSWSEEYPYIENSNNATNLCTEHCCGSEDSSHWCMYDLKPGTAYSTAYSIQHTVQHTAYSTA
jgi:arylsulfatase A-like enzyme